MIKTLYHNLFFVLPLVFFWQTRFPLFNQYYASDYLIGFVYVRELVIAAFVITGLIAERNKIVIWVKSFRWLVILSLILIITAGTSSWFAIVPSIAVYRTVLLVLYVSFSFVFSYTVHSYHRKWENWLLWWCVPFLIIGVLAVFEFVRGYSLGIWILGNWHFSTLSLGIAKISIWGHSFLRPYATFPHPNVLGGVSAIFLFFSLYVWRHSTTRLVRRVALLCVAAQWLLILISFSRSAWLGLLFSIVLIFIARLRDKRLGEVMLFQKRWVVLAFVVCVMSAPYILKLFSLHTPSIAERIYLLRQANTLIEAVPITGIGYGNFVASLVSELEKLPPIVYQPVHNVWVLSLSEIGLVGVFAYLFIWVTMMFLIYRKRYILKEYVVLQIMLVISFIGLFDHYFWSITIGQAVWWLIIAMGMVMLQSETDEK
ncbi:O-antigen ligase family protein [candidate division WWE3 bacterium]|uniref:O-antigen ligase family protein n=1 Tax=candidate division WWE3 bacterium TaxID=2053526 RepID=A0A955LH01_UNCKA|nr:O-antigen ligase family protein [candidate division WWE3 bacterium]